MPGSRRPGPICGATRSPGDINDGTLAKTPMLGEMSINPPMGRIDQKKDKLIEEKPDVNLTGQLSELFGRHLFTVLCTTPSYTGILDKAGLAPPYEGPENERAVYHPRFYQTWTLYAQFIANLVKAAQSLDPNTMGCTTIPPGTTIYRLIGSDAEPDPKAWFYGTNYKGDWWFEEKLWELVLTEVAEVDLDATDMSVNRMIRARLRRHLAVAVDWSKGLRVVRMTIPPKGPLPAVTGIGLPVPAYSAGVKSQILEQDGGTKYIPGGKSLGSPHMRFRHILLPGGFRQYWVPFTPNDVPIVTERDLST